MERSPLHRDRYALYEASVQSEDHDLDFFERVYRAERGHRFRLLREDFCGTAALAATWVARDASHRAIGLDRDPEPLAWARRHRLARMGRAASRIRLLRRDVRVVTRPPVDVVAALNFSFWVFKRRADVLRYFRCARRSLARGGLFFVNAFGGTEAMGALTERRRIVASQGPDGLRIPCFTYVWEQARFDPVTHDLLCYIHFRLGDGTSIRRAFRYHWRLWTLPEIREVLIEAGFARADVYTEAWNDRLGRPAGGYRKRESFENQEGWLAFVVGVT